MHQLNLLMQKIKAFRSQFRGVRNIDFSYLDYLIFLLIPNFFELAHIYLFIFFVSLVLMQQ
jgi:hypothetical protein